jgi:hypothetical protein
MPGRAYAFARPGIKSSGASRRVAGRIARQVIRCDARQVIVRIVRQVIECDVRQVAGRITRPVARSMRAQCS